MHDRLVVGFDGSPNAVAAVRWAAREAEQRNAAVRVIGSYAAVPVVDYYGVSAGEAAAAETEQRKQDCLAALRTVVDEVAHGHRSVGFDYLAVDQLAARALVDAAKDADLLVAGSSRAGTVRSFLLGSVMAEVLHESPCPVVIVPLRVPDKTTRIVVGIDGSECSNRALCWAADESQRLDGSLVVVHAWHYPYRITEGSFERGCDIVQVDAALVLEQAVALARDRTTTPVTSVLAEGGAAQCLLDESERADLLVVGSRGRGGLRSMLFGSVALAVAAQTACPAVVVR